MLSLATAVPLVLVALLGYAALCALSPLGICRKCGGFGFKVHQNRRGRLVRGKTCRRCRGYGQRVRIGRHLYNLVSRLHREGNN
ncbi:hypothetical protein OG552_17475 [Streptomyces sp. NBC_01476]|uniref:hypothetical protein n=1 Tax=Streptomyces sp. NBC_01476 TaxID=2903881 RepID=UPI002E35CECE|nr:hypothetical protein [Streptomyces sp. NBC_01476]